MPAHSDATTLSMLLDFGLMSDFKTRILSGLRRHPVVSGTLPATSAAAPCLCQFCRAILQRPPGARCKHAGQRLPSAHEPARAIGMLLHRAHDDDGRSLRLVTVRQDNARHTHANVTCAHAPAGRADDVSDAAPELLLVARCQSQALCKLLPACAADEGDGVPCLVGQQAQDTLQPAIAKLVPHKPSKCSVHLCYASAAILLCETQHALGLTVTACTAAHTIGRLDSRAVRETAPLHCAHCCGCICDSPAALASGPCSLSEYSHSNASRLPCTMFRTCDDGTHDMTPLMKAAHARLLAAPPVGTTWDNFIKSDQSQASCCLKRARVCEGGITAHLVGVLCKCHPHVRRVGQPAYRLQQLLRGEALRQEQQRQPKRRIQIRGDAGVDAGVPCQVQHRLLQPAGDVQLVPVPQVAAQRLRLDDAILYELRCTESGCSVSVGLHVKCECKCRLQKQGPAPMQIELQLHYNSGTSH